MSATNSDGGVDVSLLEKRLESLRDTQESVQGLSIWCQANKKFATTIIEIWLKCLKKSPVEKRLTLFHLANDVVQHAKRKGDTTLINQWAVAVQKATPHVRSPSSISSAIARIFKIWEERNVYSRDAVADLLALLNTASAKEKTEKRTSTKKPETYTASAEKVQKFDPATMISKVKSAYRMKSHLGNTFRTKQYFNMKMDQLIGSIKDRQHGMEVVQELTQLLEECRNSEHKLQTEVEERRKLVEIAEIGIVSYENIRGEAGIVNTAYKNFTNRVESTKEKVDEKLVAFQAMESPEPSFPSSSNYNSDGTNFESLKSIRLPPDPGSRPSEKGTTIYTDYSSAGQRQDDRGESDYQKSLYNSSLPSTSIPTPYDISSVPWTNDAYSNMMTNMMQMQYQPPPPLPQVPVTNSAPPTFTLTPSMQLQMQMQQQQVALQQQFQSPQGYNSINNNYQTHSGQGKSTNFGTGDLGSIPLPSLSDNPPLPPEPNHASITNTNAPALHDSYCPPLPPDYSNDQQSKHDSSFGSSVESPSTYGTQPPPSYNPYIPPPFSDRNSNGPGFTSTPRPRNPEFSNSETRFQGNNNAAGFNGYNSADAYDNSSGAEDSSLFDSQRLQPPGPHQNYGDRDFNNSKGALNLNGDSATDDGGHGGSAYDTPEFYGRSYNMRMGAPRMTGPKPSRMFQPGWSGGRGRPPHPYDMGNFRRGGRGIRGFGRPPRRGGFR